MQTLQTTQSVFLQMGFAKRAKGQRYPKLPTPYTKAGLESLGYTVQIVGEGACVGGSGVPVPCKYVVVTTPQGSRVAAFLGNATRIIYPFSNYAVLSPSLESRAAEQELCTASAAYYGAT